MGLSDMRQSLKNVFSLENIAFLFVIALIVMHIGSMLVVKVFGLGVKIDSVTNKIATCSVAADCGTTGGYLCSNGYCTQTKLLTEFIPGPYILFLVAAIVVYFVFGVIRRGISWEYLFTWQSFALLVVVAAVIAVFFIYFDALVPDLFKPAAELSGRMLGIKP